MNIQFYGKQIPINKAMIFKKRKNQRHPLIDDLNIINGWRKHVQFNAIPVTLH